MNIAGIQFLVALAGAFLSVALVVWRRRGATPLDRGAGTTGVVASVPAVAVIASIWILQSARVLPEAEQDVGNRPIKVEEGGYVSSTKCRACHADEWRTWHRSYHRTMTQVATANSVVGAFDGTTHTVLNQRLRLEREGDAFFVDFGGGRMPIVMTTGSHHMQAYWFATGDRREVALLPLVYLRGDERWIPERASFLKPSWEQLGRKTLPRPEDCGTGLASSATQRRPSHASQRRTPASPSWGSLAKLATGPRTNTSRHNRTLSTGISIAWASHRTTRS